MEQPPVVSTVLEPQNVAGLRTALRSAHTWMKFLGILFVIVGGIYALTIVGIIVAWLPIWVGVILIQGATRGRAYAEGGAAVDLIAWVDKVKTYFTIYGIVAIVGIIAALIGAIIALAVTLILGPGFMPNMMPNFPFPR